MTVGIAVEIAPEEPKDQQHRFSAETRPRVLEGTLLMRERLRRALQFDDRKMPASGQVAHAHFDGLPAATLDLRLRPAQSASSR